MRAEGRVIRRSSLAIGASIVLAAVLLATMAAGSPPKHRRKRAAAVPVAATTPTTPDHALEVPQGGGEDLAPALTSSTAGTSTTATSTLSGPHGPVRRTINYYALLSEDALTVELERRHAARGTYPELLERLTRGLVGAPYVLSPLGEGAAPDLDPRFRLDAFDCTTFVETALALARCDALPDIARELDQIRYDGGAPSYAKRRHLVTAQWIPELVAAGYVEDITPELGGDDTAWIQLQLDAQRWKKRRVARAVELAPEQIPTGTFPLPYIPIAAALRRAKDVPPGTILDVVRSDWIGAPEVVTHQGLVLQRPGEATLYVRHASPVARRVIDEPLEHMLQRYAKPKQAKAWPVVGVHLLRVLDPTPLVAAKR